MGQIFEYRPVLLANLIPLFFVLIKGSNHFRSVKILLTSCALMVSTFNLTAQDTTRVATKDTTINMHSGAPVKGLPDTISQATLTPKQVHARVRFVAISNGLEYSALLIGLNAEWYANYPRSSFHFFNDNAEWLQVDKVGHMYSAYAESRMSMELWRWTGISRKKRIWYGGLTGVFYQTVIETLDGFSKEWGWSWGDFSANVLGSGALIAQELAWNDQRIKLKFSFHKNNYNDPGLEKRANEIYGKSITERFIKDYNAQTYWASANLRAFMPESNLPPWLSIAVGYGADGMFGARDNLATDDNGIVTFDRRDIKRYRQWFLSPDIDFSKIKTKKKSVRTLFMILSAFKFPAPSLEFSKGKFKVHALHF